MKNLLLISFLLIFLVSDAQITEVDTVYNQDSTGKVIALAVTKKSEVLTTFNVPSNFSFSQSEFAILSKEGGVVKQVKKDKDILVELFPPKVVERFAVKEYERRGENVLISDVGEILALNDKLHFFPAIFIALLVFPFFCLLILSISNAYIEGNGIFNRFARLRLLLSFFLFIGFLIIQQKTTDNDFLTLIIAGVIMGALIGIVSAKNNIKDTLVVALGMWLVGSAVVIMSVFRPTWEAFWQYIWYLTGVMTLCFIIREIIQYYRQARKSTASIGI